MGRVQGTSARWVDLSRSCLSCVDVRGAYATLARRRLLLHDFDFSVYVTLEEETPTF